MRQKNFLIGDKVKVSPKAQLMDINGDTYTIGDVIGKDLADNIIGRIVMIEHDMIYGIDIGKEIEEFTHDINGILPQFHGIITESRYLIPLEKREVNRSKVGNFEIILSANEFVRIHTNPSKIRSIEDRIKSRQDSIRNHVNNIRDIRNDITKYNLEKVKLLKASKKERHGLDYYSKMYQRILKHPDVKNIEIGELKNPPQKENKIYVFTKPLFYKAPENTRDFYEGTLLGEFIIRLCISQNSFFYSAVNKSLWHNKGTEGTYIFHPCIDGTNICIGDITARAIDDAMKDNELAEAIYHIINFLKQPDYGQPFLPIQRWALAQKMNLKLESTEDYFKSSQWHNLRWDDEQYAKDNERLKEAEEAWKANREARITAAVNASSSE